MKSPSPCSNSPPGPVRAAVADEGDADVREGALEYAPAAFPGGAGGRQLVERIDAVVGPQPVDPAQHVVEGMRLDRPDGSFANRRGRHAGSLRLDRRRLS